MSVVIGVYHTIEDVENTIKALLDKGFTDDDIGVVVRDSQKGTTIADDIGREYASGATPRKSAVMSRSTVWDRFPEGFDEDIRREGLPTDAMPWYEQHLDAGDVLLVVNAGDRTDDTMRIMRDHRGELYHGMKGMRPEAAAMRPEATAMRPEAMAATNEFRVPIIDEEVTVEKTERQVGEVHVTTETTRDTVEMPTVVTHQEIRVERRKLDHPLTPDEYKGRRFEQGEIRMPIVEDEIHVVKRPVIREELVVIRVPVTERQTLREEVTHTEPHVETTGRETPEEKRRRGEAA